MNAHQRRVSQRAIARLRDVPVRLPDRHWTGARRGTVTGALTPYPSGNAAVQLVDSLGRTRRVPVRLTALRDAKGRRIRHALMDPAAVRAKR